MLVWPPVAKQEISTLKPFVSKQSPSLVKRLSYCMQGSEF